MIKLTLPYPISANRYWRTFRGVTVLSKEARAYKEAVKLRYARVEPYGASSDISVAITIHPKLTAKGVASKTLIDLDNGLKVTIDSLQGIAYVNDQQIKKIVAEYGEPVKDGGLTVMVDFFHPKYCDVIINRWQWFNGKQVTLESTGETYAELSNG